MTTIFPKGYQQNATDMIVMLVREGVPLKSAKKIVWELRQSGEINLNSLEQARRKVMKNE
jgi:hypothetical protein